MRISAGRRALASNDVASEQRRAVRPPLCLLASIPRSASSRPHQEREIYDHARGLYDAHAARAGAAFEDARAALDGAIADGGCVEVKRAQQKFVKSLPNDVLPFHEKTNCGPSLLFL